MKKKEKGIRVRVEVRAFTGARWLDGVDVFQSNSLIVHHYGILMYWSQSKYPHMLGSAYCSGREILISLDTKYLRVLHMSNSYEVGCNLLQKYETTITAGLVNVRKCF